MPPIAGKNHRSVRRILWHHHATAQSPARWDKRHRVRGTTNRGRIGASTITSRSSDSIIDISISIIQSNYRIANSPSRSSATVELVVGFVALPSSSALALPPTLRRSDAHPSSEQLRTALQPRSRPPTPPAASRASRTPWTGSSRSLDKSAELQHRRHHQRALCPVLEADGECGLRRVHQRAPALPVVLGGRLDEGVRARLRRRTQPVSHAPFNVGCRGAVPPPPCKDRHRRFGNGRHRSESPVALPA
jgi:hypothetical protein